MTPEEKLKEIVVGIDGVCWHSYSPFWDANGSGYICAHCENKVYPIHSYTGLSANLSSYSMDDLLQIAKKMNVVVSFVQDPQTDCSVRLFSDLTQIADQHAETPALALLEALYHVAEKKQL